MIIEHYIHDSCSDDEKPRESDDVDIYCGYNDS